LSIKNINVHNDWVDINLGHSGILDTHMTIVYKKNIIAHKEKVLDIIKTTLEEIKPQQITQNNTQVNCDNYLCQDCINLVLKIKNCHCSQI
jgi:hypothetical protein